MKCNTKKCYIVIRWSCRITTPFKVTKMRQFRSAGAIFLIYDPDPNITSFS